MAKAKTKPENGNGAAETLPTHNVDGEFGAMDNPEIRAAAIEVFDRIAALESERDVINAEIKGHRESLVSRGLNKEGIKVAERYRKLQEQHRDGFDRTVAIVRKAFELPLQLSMIPAPVEGEVPGDDETTGHGAAVPPATS